MAKKNRHQMPKWQKRTGTKCQNGKREPAPNAKKDPVPIGTKCSEGAPNRGSFGSVK